jgi:hypothetical protein
LTDYGWTWASDYSWGWAPFHYGRWDFDHYYGWFWIPGNEWGPAWVSWRRAEGYYGWEPMEPGISLSVSFGRGYDSHNDHWIFVRDRDIDRGDINHYYIGSADHDRIVRRSSVINNTYTDNSRHTTYSAGPARADVQKVAGRQVKPVAIQEYNKPGQQVSNGQFHIYRPVVVNSSNKAAKPAPSRIANLKDVKQPSERNSINSNREVTNVKSSQPKVIAPSQNIRSDRQPNNIKSQNANPPQNIRTDVKSDNVKSQNANPPKIVRTDVKSDNVKSQNANPPKNVGTEVKSNNVKSQNANPPKIVRTDVKSNNVKSQNANPPLNVTRDAPPNNVRSQNPPPSQNIRVDRQQNNVKEQKLIPQQNAVRLQQSTSAKNSGNNNKGQDKRSGDAKDIKENKENK